MLAALLIVVSTILPSPCPQDGSPAQKIPEGFPTGAPGTQAQSWTATDGQPATPGRIPEGTSQAALKLWNSMLSASHMQKALGPTAPVTSFDLTFGAELRSKPGTPSKDETVNFRFLDQDRGFLSAEFLRSRRKTVRGPKGDYLLDGKEWVSMQGREDIESRRELDRWVAIARNFVALTQPAGVRLIELRELSPVAVDLGPQVEQKLDKQGIPLPVKAMHRIEFGAGRFLSLPTEKTLAAANGLHWLEVTSPDFRLFDSGARGTTGAASAYRAILGLEKNGRVRIAQFHDDNGGAVNLQGALFVEILRWQELDSGYVLPKELNTFRSDPTRAHQTFEVQPTLSLTLHRRTARINPKRPALKASDFTPLR